MTTLEEPPLYRTGKICYIEIPATNVIESAEFYKRAFGCRPGSVVTVRLPSTIP